MTKGADPEVKIATAAARAKATRNTVSTVTKRKQRTDDTAEETNNKDQANDEPMEEDTVKPKTTRGRKRIIQVEHDVKASPDEEITTTASASAPPIVKATRGRPKKAVEEASQPEVYKTTRGRVKKVEVVEEPPMEEAPPAEPKKPARGRQKKVEIVEEPSTEEALLVEPTKPTRGRPRKADVTEEPPIQEAPPVEAAKSTRGRAKKVVATEEPPAEVIPKARGRPATISKASTFSKKSVKFEEPQEQDKENIIPEIVANSKGKDLEAGTGLKAKPVRKPAANTRAVRCRTKTNTGEEKLPLTPKKATQVATAKDSVSEDELATMEKTPMKLLTKSPAKAPGSGIGTAKKLDFTTSIAVNRAEIQHLGSSLMGSPARRPPPSPYKDSLKASPKRINLGDSILGSPFKSSIQQAKHISSPFKASLLQSPAKRPQSPMKAPNFGSPDKFRSAIGATPKFNVSRFGATPRTLTKSSNPPRRSLVGSPSKQVPDEMPSIDSNLNTMTIKPFPGRLSSILPREADPIMQGSSASIETTQVVNPNNTTIPEEDESSIDPINGDAMLIDSEPQDINMDAEDPRSTTPTNSPSRHSIGNFSLRDEDPFQDSESEDELASGSPKYSPAPLNAFKISSKDFASPSTRNPALALRKTPKTAVVFRPTAEDQRNMARSQSVKASKNQVGFMPLSRRVSDWMSATAENCSSPTSPPPLGYDRGIRPDAGTVIQLSPAKGNFFEEAMTSGGAATSDDTLGVSSTEPNDDIDALSFAPTTLDEEDLALAVEADEMSLIAVGGAEAMGESVDILNRSIHADARTVSEASQEYGDENAVPIDSNPIPIDPALLAFDAQHQALNPSAIHNSAIFTPVRVLGERERVFHTVSKVPLKPAAEDSPLKLNKQSVSVSRLQAQRHAPPPPSFAVPKLLSLDQPAVLTPARSNSWSTTATPVRTPRRDINEQVLKGAVVFVDVHTTEGADASAVFVELLGQMGARCVKSWNWNPNTPNSPDSVGSSQADKQQTPNWSSSKIGITHVVFKDGGKRTLEKVKESKGVVLCVGVGWVLE